MRDTERVAIRLRMEHLLSGADLWPPEMPPSAVLLVQRLDDPLPGRLVDHPGDLWPSRAWVEAMRSRLALLWRNALRVGPLRGGPFPGAARSGGGGAAPAVAVAFDSPAEQAACLAVRLARGGSAPEWWEQQLLQALPARTVAAVLRSRPPAELPAIFGMLQGWGEAGRVAAAVPEAEALSLMQAMASAHGLGWVAELDAPAVNSPAPNVAAGTLGSDGAEGTAGYGAAAALPEATQAAAAPVPPQPGPVPGGVRPATAREGLLTLATTLAASPGKARSQRFALAFRLWWKGQGVMPGMAPVGESFPAAGVERGAAAPDRTAPGALAAGAAAAPGTAPPVAVIGGDRNARRRELRPRASLPVQPARPTGEEAGNGLPAPAEPGLAEELQAGLAEAPAPSISFDLADGTDTRLGGLFYLINLFTRLDLPDSISGLGEAVSPWALLDAVARGLLDVRPDDSGNGDSGDGDFGRDPIWRLLAILDGREPASLPGADCPPPPEAVCLPADWLELPDGDPFRPGLLSGALTPGLLAWLERLIPYLSAWLREATDLPVAAILTLPCRVHMTASQIDLVMPLDAALLPVRLAGLDRDPGWLHRFGRMITFYFR